VSNAPITTYLDTENIALPYCPGCGHKGIVMQLDKALVKLQLDPKKVVIVTDIGCIGLADRNFMTNTFHGLHGRSITYVQPLRQQVPPGFTAPHPLTRIFQTCSLKRSPRKALQWLIFWNYAARITCHEMILASLT
jgi:hypothetical protein